MRFRYSYLDGIASELRRMPLLPCTLHYAQRQIDVVGLVDSGSSVNVLPYRIGLELGAKWDDNLAGPTLGGIYPSLATMPLALFASIGDLTSVRLVFAWTKSDDVRVVLGQANFFMEFDVHFYRSQFEFEINPKSK